MSSNKRKSTENNRKKSIFRTTLGKIKLFREKRGWRNIKAGKFGLLKLENESLKKGVTATATFSRKVKRKKVKKRLTC